ncbi:MAG: creatininase family protein, partial [Acidobacteria bacterium]|nr:creatininase family protein [Acidobacteriota bacterium]
MKKHLLLLLAGLIMPAIAAGQPTNPVWHEEKVRNYLPHMTWPEVQELRLRTDMVIIPIAALEQHSLHLPIGTDYLNGLERAKLVAQKTDVLVAPILLPGNSPYHMEFPGTITLSAQTIQQVYFEAAQSLMRHGFTRVLLLNSHGGNQVITRYIADRINQETEGVAIELGEAAAPFLTRAAPTSSTMPPRVFDRHGGVGETSASLYMTPNLVNLEAAKRATLTMPEHLQKMLPDVVAGDPTAMLVFLAEGLKAKSTGKNTSTREMSDTGTWGLRDPKEATVEQGRR